MFENVLGLFERSGENIWTDEYISKNLLAAHLDNSSNGASRKAELRTRTLQWINRQVRPASSIVDFGCGPGLYAYELGKSGHKVLGMDINRESILFAEEYKKLDGFVDYRYGNYLEDTIEGTYDAAMMIWCDFGALIPDEQRVLLGKVRNVLTGDGIFIFDVFGNGLLKNKPDRRSWTISGGSDFWSHDPYFLLEEIKHFEAAHAIGTRDFVIDQKSGTAKEYIMWDQYYDHLRIRQLMDENGFEVKETDSGIIGKTDDDVLFIVAGKKGD